MPQKKISKQNAAKAQKNRLVSQALLEDDTAQLAVVEKALGHLQFQIRISKDKTARALLRGLFRGKAVRIEVNDLVQISRRDFEGDKSEHYDILCRVEPKHARQLRKDGRLKSLVGEDTWEFEVGEDAALESDESDGEKTTAKAPVEEDVDVDVDAI